MYGEDDRTIPGNALTVAPNSPLRALQREGNAFLSRFEGSLCAAPLLEHLSLIDTPETGAYDAALIAVGHREFQAMGIEAIRGYCKPTHVVYDVKYTFPAEATDGRL